MSVDQQKPKLSAQVVFVVGMTLFFFLFFTGIVFAIQEVQHDAWRSVLGMLAISAALPFVLLLVITFVNHD